MERGGHFEAWGLQEERVEIPQTEWTRATQHYPAEKEVVRQWNLVTWWIKMIWPVLIYTNNHNHRVSRRTCPWRSMWEMRRTWTGPGPQWAMGGVTVTERLVSEARGKLSGSPGIVRVQFTCTACDLMLAKLWRDSEIKNRDNNHYWPYGTTTLYIHWNNIQ